MVKFVHLIIFSFIILLPHTAGAADFTHNLASGKDQREFIVHIPDNLKDKKDLPVVIVLHGGGGDAEGVRRQTGMDEVADRNGFIAVYPQGTGALLKESMRTWNAGACCGAAARRKIDDVGFISKMIDFLVEKYGVDRSRVYATGHSNGGMMSWRLACELSDKIAAVAPHSGQRLGDDCHPKRPVAVLHIHGTADPCAPYQGGRECGGCFVKLLHTGLPGDRWTCRPVRDVLRDAALMNGCKEITDIVFSRGSVTCEAFEGCPKDAPVELCSMEGAGHVWGGAHGGEAKVCADKPEGKACKTYRDTVGPPDTDIDSSQFMWDFFRDIRLPEKPL